MLLGGARTVGGSSRFSVRWAVGVALLIAAPAVGQGQQQEIPSRAAGFRQLDGRYLTLTTDLPPAEAIDELPRVFDLAVPQWCEYFDVPRERLEGWRLRGYLMGQRERFRQAGWLPANLPEFPHGYQRGDQLWVMEQPSDYYRRHLLLHEGTHAFMNRWLGGTGPPWFMEGVAELLATHRYQDGRLELKVLPPHKEDVPEWGRIKLIREAVDGGRGLSLDDVLQFPPRQFSDVDAYAWSWAAATLLDGHPRWHNRFQQLLTRVRVDRDRFNARLQTELAADRPLLDEAWQIFLDQIDYGYDVAQDQVVDHPLQKWSGHAMVRVDSRQGWQSTGLRLEAGQRYRLVASGRYRLKGEDPPWFSEAGGVTIEYRQGKPLGLLLAAVRPDPKPGERTALVQPQALGLEAELRPTRTGTLFLRINEAAGQLADNEGALTVDVQQLGPTD